MAAEWILNIKEIVVTIAAGIGACVALRGLSTWKKQIKGQTEYALAKETLINIYKLRDEVSRARNPFLFAHEQPSPSQDVIGTMSPEQIRYYGLSGAYQKRWEKVVQAKSSLSVNLTEAEAVWGIELKSLAESYFSQTNYLHTRIYQYLRLNEPGVNEEAKRVYQRDIATIHDVIYDSMDDDDEFNKKLRTSLKPIEDYLRNKMHS